MLLRNFQGLGLFSVARALETKREYIENNLAYQGRVESYEECDYMQELVMYDVAVFRYEDSVQLYSVPTVYLTKEMGRFIIEAIPKELLGEANDD